MRKTINLAAAVAAVEQQQAQALTLGELVDAWTACALNGSDTRLRKWVTAFGSDSAWDITSERLDAAAQAMHKHGYKPSAINRDLSALGSAYRWAISQRLSPRGFRSPTLDVKRMEEAIRVVDISRKDINAVRARARGHRDRGFAVFVELLVDTGARKSELLLRRWRDVDLEKRQITCDTTKTGVPRVLHFQPETLELMLRVFPRRDPDTLVFPGRVPGRPVSFRKAWEQAVADVGLPTLHMHDIRHAAAAQLLRSGVPLGVAAQVLGHSPQVLARRYGHLDTEALRMAQEKAWNAAR